MFRIRKQETETCYQDGNLCNMHTYKGVGAHIVILSQHKKTTTITTTTTTAIMTRAETTLSSSSTYKITKPAPRKLTNAQLQRTLKHKRCKTLISKSDQLVKLGARVYMVAEVNGRYHVYSSESSDSWPPTEASLVSARLPMYQDDMLIQLQSRNYPVPIRYRPQDKELIDRQLLEGQEDDGEKDGQ
jgi:hypothetical protein